MLDDATQNRPGDAARIDEVDTPCLLLDQQRLDANIRRLSERMASFGMPLRPHLKTAKSIDVARRVMPTHAGPATVSTLKEAEIFAAAGVTDMIYAVGIAPGKLDRVAALRRAGADLVVLVDSTEQAEAVRWSSRETGIAIPALIEIDCDGHRSGVKPDNADDLVAIGKVLTDGAELRGVLTHAGDSYSVDTVAAFEAYAARERAAAVQAAAVLRAAGLPCPVVSVGATPTALFGRDYSGLTEVRAGVFMFCDLMQAGIGVCGIDDIAISVLSTVIGRNRTRGRLIIDAGWMALSRDRGTAGQKVDQGYGLVCDLQGRPYADLIVLEANQEHGIVGVRPGSEASLPDLPVGTRLRILPNHACATAAQHDGYIVVSGASPRIEGHWPRFGGW